MNTVNTYAQEWALCSQKEAWASGTWSTHPHCSWLDVIAQSTDVGLSLPVTSLGSSSPIQQHYLLIRALHLSTHTGTWRPDLSKCNSWLFQPPSLTFQVLTRALPHCLSRLGAISDIVPYYICRDHCKSKSLTLHCIPSNKYLHCYFQQQEHDSFSTVQQWNGGRKSRVVPLLVRLTVMSISHFFTRV